MVRRYADRPVAPESLDRLLANATRGPSAGFSQGQAFLVLDTPADVARFWVATGAPPPVVEEGAPAPVSKPNGWLDGMRTAPVVIVPLAHKDAYLDRYAEPDKGWTDRDESRWPVPYWHVDTGMAALLILQTAVDEGLGACFFGIPGEHVDSFREAFGVPADHVPVGAITVGHRPAEAGAPEARGSAARRARRTDAVHHGRW